ncbi:MAG TPA: COX15/CtaA family protein [Bacteroidota bacterium]|nr:COX15/CtaA family protein [Bacteroidota bacterium]
MIYHRGPHRLAVFTAASTFLLIIAGALVTSTGSGLSVPDWPNTYGRFMFAYPLDEMVGGIFYEHTHRMIASVVGLLTVVLSVWVWRRESRRWVKILTLAALAAVVLQGVLGGITVLFLLPTAVSVAHATLAQTFFALVSSVALVTSRWWAGPPRPDGTVVASGGSSLTTLAIGASILVWIQLILGAVMRHTASGLAVPDFPLAYGSLFPALSPQALQHYTETLIGDDIRIAADGPITAGQVAVHLLHRYWGILTGVVLVWTAVKCVRSVGVSSRLRALGMILATVTILQVTLGAFTVIWRKPVDLTTAHVALGAFLLVMTVMIALHSARLFGVHRSVRVPRVSEAAA